MSRRLNPTCTRVCRRAPTCCCSCSTCKQMALKANSVEHHHSRRVVPCPGPMLLGMLWRAVPRMASAQHTTKLVSWRARQSPVPPPTSACIFQQAVPGNRSDRTAGQQGAHLSSTDGAGGQQQQPGEGVAPRSQAGFTGAADAGVLDPCYAGQRPHSQRGCLRREWQPGDRLLVCCTVAAWLQPRAACCRGWAPCRAGALWSWWLSWCPVGLVVWSIVPSAMAVLQRLLQALAAAWGHHMRLRGSRGACQRG